jgi:hypothetical protein
MITVQIKPEKHFANAKKVMTTQFNVKSLNDNLYDEVTFLYTLLDESGNWLGEATTTLSGRENYLQWDATATGAYKIVADAVGFEIVDDAPKLFTFEA